MKRHGLIVSLLFAVVVVVAPAVALCSEVPAIATQASVASPQQPVPEPQVDGSEPLFFAGRGLSQTEAACTANCGSYPSVSCNAGTSCTAVDRNCAGYQQGYC